MKNRKSYAAKTKKEANYINLPCSLCNNLVFIFENTDQTASDSFLW